MGHGRRDKERSPGRAHCGNCKSGQRPRRIARLSNYVSGIEELKDAGDKGTYTVSISDYGRTTSLATGTMAALASQGP